VSIAQTLPNQVVGNSVSHRQGPRVVVVVPVQVCLRQLIKDPLREGPVVI
jgi:hypothetical protein